MLEFMPASGAEFKPAQVNFFFFRLIFLLSALYCDLESRPLSQGGRVLVQRVVLGLPFKVYSHCLAPFFCRGFGQASFRIDRQPQPPEHGFQHFASPPSGFDCLRTR